MTTALALVPTALAIVRLIGNASGRVSLMARVADDAERVAIEETRAMIRSNPAGALAIIGDRKNNRLSLWQNSLFMDEIVGQIEDPEVAQQLIADHISDGYTEELLAVRGDLPSSAATVVDPYRMVGAMMRDIGIGEVDIAARALVFMAWSLKAKDRSDWGEILEMEIEGLTVMDLILLGLRVEYSDLTPDVFEDHGINALDGRERLRELRQERAGLDELDVEQARTALGKLRMVAAANKDGDLNSLAAAAAASVAAAAEEDE